MRTPLCLVLFLLGLACAGPGTPEPVPVPEVPAAAPRVLPEGDLEPAQIVTMSFDGRCHVKLTPADRELGSIMGPCPTRVMVAYKPGGLVIADEAGALTDLVKSEILPVLPDTPDAIAFDSEGKLHACGPTDIEGTEQDGKYVAEYKGQKLESDKPIIAESARVQVRWELDQKEWVEKGAELVTHLVFPGPPDCIDVDGFPKLDPYSADPGFFTSDGPYWMGTAWTTALPEDQGPLAALREGTWFVDATRTVAAQDQPGGGPYALWITDAWKIVYPGEEAAGLWILPDFVGIRDGDGGFRLFSRRDGAETFVQAENTLSLPWPEVAVPSPGEPEGEEPEGGQYGEGRGKKGKGKGKSP